MKQHSINICKKWTNAPSESSANDEEQEKTLQEQSGEQSAEQQERTALGQDGTSLPRAMLTQEPAGGGCTQEGHRRSSLLFCWPVELENVDRHGNQMHGK